MSQHPRQVPGASINAVPTRDGRGVAFLLVNLETDKQTRIKLTHEAIAAMAAISAEIQNRQGQD